MFPLKLSDWTFYRLDFFGLFWTFIKGQKKQRGDQRKKFFELLQKTFLIVLIPSNVVKKHKFGDFGPKKISENFALIPRFQCLRNFREISSEIDFIKNTFYLVLTTSAGRMF